MVRYDRIFAPHRRDRGAIRGTESDSAADAERRVDEQDAPAREDAARTGDARCGDADLAKVGAEELRAVRRARKPELDDRTR